MKKFLARATHAQQVSSAAQQHYAMRIHRMAKVKGGSSKRIVKKAADFIERTSRTTYGILELIGSLDHTGTDAELKSQLWDVQVNGRKLVKKNRSRMPKLTGLMGMYRYSLEDSAVTHIRTVYKESHNAI